MTLECMWCKGRMTRASVPFSVDRKGYHLQVDELPAWVCTQCGEPYFEEQEVARIQSVLQAVDEKMGRTTPELKAG